MQPPTVREGLENLLLSSTAEDKKLSDVFEEFSRVLYHNHLYLEAGVVANSSIQIRAWEILEHGAKVANGK